MLSAVTSLTPYKTGPKQHLNHAHPHTKLFQNKTVTTSDRLKWRTTDPLKRDRFLCKCVSRPLLQRTPEDTDVKHAKLVEGVRELISNDTNDVKFDDLLMVDTLERLGLDYLYEDEINLILEQCHIQLINNDLLQHPNLYEVSLCFRILRQNGYRVSADIFEQFKGKNDEFVDNLKSDIRGLMELYEASHLCIEGDDILDEAAIFSSHMLQKSLNFLDDKEAKMVKYTLENPHRRNFTSFSLHKDFDAKILKELAELESRMVKSIRKTEINEIIRWWDDLGLGKELNLARNQPLKWYIVPMVSLSNPTLSQQRIDLTKTVYLIYIIDDIFDIYGSLSELTLLTEAVSMWDTGPVEQLPYYAKLTFKALYDTTNEIACRVYEKHGFNPINSLRNSWVTLFDAFLVEAKWFASGYIPKSEEYLKNGMVSTGLQVFLVHMFFLLGDGVTEEDAYLIDNDHGIVSSGSKILRLTDDLVSEQYENQDGHNGSYVKCLLMEHEDCSRNLVQEQVKQMISDEWKCLNKEFLFPNPFSKHFLKGSVKLARLVPLVYGYKQNNSFDQIEEHINSFI
ncbi:(3S,6E)-nerolidol synthase 1-like [Bidens hawaiensis]|uniref:(3S,6E)-nerolidol synthase 1-like n=1 Tax=Bidens hawaiensis TaxID=980011 RepID=UPI004049E646